MAGSLAGGDSKKISTVCQKYGFPDPWDNKYPTDFKKPMKL